MVPHIYPWITNTRRVSDPSFVSIPFCDTEDDTRTTAREYTQAQLCSYRRSPYAVCGRPSVGEGVALWSIHPRSSLAIARARERERDKARQEIPGLQRISHRHHQLGVPNHQGTMVATATMVGAIMGLSCQLYSNGVRKLPLMRRKHLPFNSSSHVYTHSFVPLLFRSIYETALKIRCILPLPFGWSPLLQSFCFLDN
jgi:hypothetical protein